jgi:hypothetical protein
MEFASQKAILKADFSKEMERTLSHFKLKWSNLSLKEKYYEFSNIMKKYFKYISDKGLEEKGISQSLDETQSNLVSLKAELGWEILKDKVNTKKHQDQQFANHESLGQNWSPMHRDF